MMMFRKRRNGMFHGLRRWFQYCHPGIRPAPVRPRTFVSVQTDETDWMSSFRHSAVGVLIRQLGMDAKYLQTYLIQRRPTSAPGPNCPHHLVPQAADPMASSTDAMARQ